MACRPASRPPSTTELSRPRVAASGNSREALRRGPGRASAVRGTLATIAGLRAPPVLPYPILTLVSAPSQPCRRPLWVVRQSDRGGGRMVSGSRGAGSATRKRDAGLRRLSAATVVLTLGSVAGAGAAAAVMHASAQAGSDQATSSGTSQSSSGSGTGSSGSGSSGTTSGSQPSSGSQSSSGGLQSPSATPTQSAQVPAVSSSGS